MLLLAAFTGAATRLPRPCTAMLQHAVSYTAAPCTAASRRWPQACIIASGTVQGTCRVALRMGAWQVQVRAAYPPGFLVINKTELVSQDIWPLSALSVQYFVSSPPSVSWHLISQAPIYRYAGRPSRPPAEVPDVRRQLGATDA